MTPDLPWRRTDIAAVAATAAAKSWTVSWTSQLNWPGQG